MAAQPPRTEQLTLKSLMYLELLVASLLPVAAILLVGVVGTRLIMPEYIEIFAIIFFLAAVLVFSGEFALLMIMQRAIKGHFSDLIAVCQAYLAGHKTRRAVLHDDQDLTTPLAKALNALLDSVVQPVPQPLPSQPASPQHIPQPMSPQPLPQWISHPAPPQQAPKKDLVEQGDLVDKLFDQGDSLLKKQLKQLVREVNPALEADLRVKAAVPTGDIGVVADVCNYLIEELVQNVQWVRQASEQVIVVTREMLNRSIEMAQTIEEQMVQLSNMTETIEKVAAFMQQMGSTLQLSVDIAEEVYSHTHEKTLPLKELTDRTTPIVNSVPPVDTHLKQNMQRQVELLGGSLETTQEHATLAESIIGDLYTFAQRLHHSSTDVLDTAERIGSLITLAEQWRNSVAAFQLPEDEATQQLFIKEAASQAMLPIPTSGSSRPEASQKGVHIHNHFSGDRS